VKRKKGEGKKGKKERKKRKENECYQRYRISRVMLIGAEWMARYPRQYLPSLHHPSPNIALPPSFFSFCSWFFHSAVYPPFLVC